MLSITKTLLSMPVALSLTACIATTPETQPTTTTYPTKLVRQYTLKAGIPIPGTIHVSAQLKGDGLDEQIEYSPGQQVVEFQAKFTRIGDTAEHEIYITPRNRGEFSEKRLMARIEESGKITCNGAHRVSATKYFYGPEATLKFLNIATPALRVIYRCPVITGQIKEPDAQFLNDISKKFSDHAFFDISSKVYPVSEDTLATKFRDFLLNKEMPIIAERAAHGGYYIVAGHDPNERRWGRIERVVAYFKGSSAESKLTFKHFSYQLTYHKRGVSGTKRRGFARGAQPWDRKTAYKRSMIFLGEFEKELL